MLGFVKKLFFLGFTNIFSVYRALSHLVEIDLYQSDKVLALIDNMDHNVENVTILESIMVKDDSLDNSSDQPEEPIIFPPFKPKVSSWLVVYVNHSNTMLSCSLLRLLMESFLHISGKYETLLLVY